MTFLLKNQRSPLWLFLRTPSLLPYVRSKDGALEYVITAAHVVKDLVPWKPNEPLDKIIGNSRGIVSIALGYDNLGATCAAEKIIFSPDDDLAVLLLLDAERPKRNAWSPAVLGSDVPKLGSHSYTWGFPSDSAFLGNKLYTKSILSTGYVSAETEELLGLDMHVHQGNSGGGLFVPEKPGTLHGIIIAKTTPWMQNFDFMQFAKLFENLSGPIFIGTVLPNGDKLNTFTALAKMMERWSEVHSCSAIAVPISRIRKFLLAQNLLGSMTE